MRYAKDIAPTLAHLEEVHLWLEQLMVSLVTRRPLNAAERRRVSTLAEKIGKTANFLDFWARCVRKPQRP